MIQKRILVYILGIMIVFTSSFSWAEYVYPMQVERKNLKLINALATKINNNQFVTDSELLKGATNIYLIDNTVTPAAKVVATVVFTDTDKRLAVISASNINGKAVTLAQNDQPIGGQLQLLTDNGAKPSIVQRFAPIDDFASGNIYVHTALYSDSQWSAPLLNNCQQLLGISLFESSLFTRMKPPEIIAYALSLSSLKDTLTKQKIHFNSSPESCLSDVEQAKHNAEQAAKKADQAAKDASDAIAAKQTADAAAEKKLQDVKKKAEEDKKQANKLLEDAKIAADKLAKENADKLKQVQEAIKKAEDDRVALEKAKQEAEEKAKLEAERNTAIEQSKVNLIVGAIAIVLLLLLAFTLIIRKRKRAFQAKDAELQEKKNAVSGLAKSNEELSGKMEKIQRGFSDILLDGETHDGRKIKLKINGRALLQSGEEGQIIGRESAQVHHPLVEPEISRKHLKISVSNDKVFVEDLQSQNGSWLNEVKLTAGQPVVLVEESMLRLSSISFKVIFHTP